ncbi:peptidase M29 [Candidatus Termititenax aidoneus]|uniref:Peptidase M29 n=1 Tax=Termititenax aidoneus TaxID=2218524 RepID=A0A388TC55_TERA1|nr:peptidase M29 [Candidatus Termititenax aidoneus]
MGDNILNAALLDKYAEVLLWGLTTAHQKKYKPYDTILLRWELPALPLAEKVYAKLVRQKLNVITRAVVSPEMEHSFYQYSDSRQRKFVARGEQELYENLHGNIFISAPDSLTHLKDIDPKKMGETAVARKFLREIAERREERGTYAWTLCTYPTRELAAKARMSLPEYTKQIIKACYLNEKDPVRKWQETLRLATEIKKWLNALPVKTFHIESAHTDLTILYGEKRRFMGVSGHNIPSFELFTSPDWRGTQGRYYANLPSYRGGNYVEGIDLTFSKGSAVKIRAKKGEEYVQKTLRLDKQANKIGEFSLTDKRFSKIDKFMADILFDENFGGASGNCHIAVGAAYSDTYAGNPKNLTKKLKAQLGFNDSALHWDLINTEQKTVTATLQNGKKVLIYEKGMFRY